MTEQLSAWMDGQLESEHASQLLSQLKRGSVTSRDWNCYHLIGDTMRGMGGSDLGAQICAHLKTEPTVLLPPRSRDLAEKPSWFAASAWANVATVAFVAFAGGMVLQALLQDSPQIPLEPLIEVNQAGVLAEEHARSYLIAHLRYSNSKSLQGLPMYASATQQ